MDDCDTITLIHFNDVYNIEPRELEPKGGAARFQTALKQRKHLNPLIVFSGDAFSPSLMSTIVKGRQMVEVLNTFNIQIAVYGNHDFDFGVEKLMQLSSDCNFPWLMSNVLDNLSDQPLANGLPWHIVNWQGHKIGFIGLVEKEWIATLSTIDADDIIFLDFVEEARFLIRELKEQGIKYVIALTHMRWPNDMKLAEEVPEIDLILGGHDHNADIEVVNNTHIVKSGTDFRQLSQITLTVGGPVLGVHVEEVIIDGSLDEDPQLKDIVHQYMDVMGERMEVVLGVMEVELEGRFSKIRTQETNLGNFVTDVMLNATDADVAILNSGTLRSDTLHPKGRFKMKDLLSILPMLDSLIVMQITGQVLYEGLENGVSQYPKLEGRFPQVSGIQFAFNPNSPPGSRINPKLVKVQGCPLDLEKLYRVCTKLYLHRGRDGYTAFENSTLLVNEEEGPILMTIIQNHFKAVQLHKERRSKLEHHQSLIPVSRRRTIALELTKEGTSVDPADIECHDYDVSHSRECLINISDSMLDYSSDSRASVSPNLSQSRQQLRYSAIRASQVRTLVARRSSLQNLEQENINLALAPQVEGRILIVNDE